MVSSPARRPHLRLGSPWGSGVPDGLIGLSTRLVLLSAQTSFRRRAPRANQLDAGPPLQSRDVGDSFLTPDDRLGFALGLLPRAGTGLWLPRDLVGHWLAQRGSCWKVVSPCWPSQTPVFLGPLLFSRVALFCNVVTSGVPIICVLLLLGRWTAVG